MSNPYPGDPYASYEQSPYQEPAYQESAYQQSGYIQPGYMPPPYQQPWGAGYVVQPVIIANRPTNGKAIASMVLGILLVLTLCTFFNSIVVPISLVLGLGTGIPAVILGHMALKEIDQSSGQQGGKEMAIAGLVLGYITLGAALLSGFLFLFFFLTVFHAAS